MKIVADLTTAAGSGFGAAVRDGELHLPIDLGQVLRRHNLLSAEELIASARAFPSLLASELGWSAAEVQAALEELASLLQGHLPRELLEAEPPPPRAYGARPPGKDGK